MKIAIVPQPGIIKSTAGGYNKRMYHLVEGLERLGHKVKIFALPGSKTKGELDTSIYFGKKPYRYSLETRQYFISEAIARSQDCDIINCQTDHLATVFDKFSKKPIVHTVITSTLPPTAVSLLKFYKKLNYSTVSGAPKKKFDFIKFKSVIYNGIDTENFSFKEKPRDYFLCLGRVAWDKGVHQAVRAARKTDIKLRIAGKKVDKPYFDKEIKPYLGKNIRYLGLIQPSKFQKKIKLIQNAKAVFMLSEVDEGFSNTVLEALACGTPVIASSRYSYREIINSGKNGFIVRNKPQLLAAIKSIDAIDRFQCRASVEKRYNYQQMALGYEKLFKKILKK